MKREKKTTTKKQKQNRKLKTHIFQQTELQGLISINIFNKYFTFIKNVKICSSQFFFSTPKRKLNFALTFKSRYIY